MTEAEMFPQSMCATYHSSGFPGTLLCGPCGYIKVGSNTMEFARQQSIWGLQFEEVSSSMKCWRWSRQECQKYKLREVKNIIYETSLNQLLHSTRCFSQRLPKKDNNLKVLLSILFSISRGWQRLNFTAFYPPIPAIHCLFLSIPTLQ